MILVYGHTSVRCIYVLSVVVLVLLSFLASTQRIETALTVVCALITVLVIFMSFVLCTLGT